MLNQILSRQDERVASFCVCCGNKKIEKNPANIPFNTHRIFDWEPAHIDEHGSIISIPIDQMIP
jgi:hypothetical protein